MRKRQSLSTCALLILIQASAASAQALPVHLDQAEARLSVDETPLSFLQASFEQPAQSVQPPSANPASFADSDYSGRRTFTMQNASVFADGFLTPNGTGGYLAGWLSVTGVTEVPTFCNFSLNTSPSASYYSVSDNGAAVEMLNWVLAAGPSVCPGAFLDMTRIALPGPLSASVKVIDFNLGGSQKPGEGSYE